MPSRTLGQPYRGEEPVSPKQWSGGGYQGRIKKEIKEGTYQGEIVLTGSKSPIKKMCALFGN